jgi:hypothetical protein
MFKPNHHVLPLYILLCCVMLPIVGKAADVGPPTGAAQADDAGQKSIDDQVAVLYQKVKSGEVAGLNDPALAVLFSTPSVVAGYLNAIVSPLLSYELWLKRQERIKGTLNDRPFLNYLKYMHAPRRVYVKWLDGGPFPGQEIIYDETKRKADVYGHLGGFLNVTSMWMSLSGMIVRANTNHNVREELSLQFFAHLLGQRLNAMQSAGVRTLQQVEVVNIGGQRRVAVTLPPSGVKSALYEGKVRFLLDVDQPMIRQFEAWDSSNEMVERIVVEKFKPSVLSALDFDPKNNNYKF